MLATPSPGHLERQQTLASGLPYFTLCHAGHSEALPKFNRLLASMKLAAAAPLEFEVVVLQIDGRQVLADRYPINRCEAGHPAAMRPRVT